MSMNRQEMNLTHKIILSHLAGKSGKTIPPVGEDISLKIDQTLTQDATGTLAYLQFEALGIDRVRTEISVSYVDHNTLQTGFENADDHRYLASVAAKYGIVFSPAGNGVCHQLHLENFAIPGKTLIGSDSHTPTAGGIAMLAMGAGGLDVACAMAGEPFTIKMPRVLGVRLIGKLKPYSGAKDVILEILRRLSVKGGVGKIIEYFGPGVKTLSVPERATIANMGAELGATTSIFPSDEITKSFLAEVGRKNDWREFSADKNAAYDEVLEIDLSRIVPLVAQPHSPDNVRSVAEIIREGSPMVQQVCIGSCTNSSIADMASVSRILKGKKVHPGVSLVISPGSRNVLETLAENGLLSDIIKSGARLIECACGPCIGMGQAPASGGDAVSVRTFNRNFEGRSGTRDARVYLASPVTAALAAIHGRFVDPAIYINKKNPAMPVPRLKVIKDMFIYPTKNRSKKTEIIRGPNIKPLPAFTEFPESIKGKILIKLPDNISTDHILPAGAKILPLRSNIPAISEYTLSVVDKSFVERARRNSGGVIVAGENYGQGSSREHAAIVLKYLGVNIVVAKSFARIHLANLVNFGVLPLAFEKMSDYDLIGEGDEFVLDDIDFSVGKLRAHIISSDGKNTDVFLVLRLTDRDKEIVRAGGLLNFIKNKRGVSRV